MLSMRSLSRAVCLGAFLFVASGNTVAQLANDNSPWEMFANRLVKRLAIQDADGKITNFQLVKEPVQADWANPKYGEAFFYSFASQLTTPGEFYSKQDLTLHQQFKNFLLSLDLPPVNEASRPAMEAARTKYEAALSGYQKIRLEEIKAWEKLEKAEARLPANRKTNYDVWYAREFGARMGLQKQRMDEFAYDYGRLLSDTFKGFAGIGGLITGLENTGYQMQITHPGGRVESVPAFNRVGDIEQFIAKGNSSDGFAETWEFDKSHERRALNWSSGGGSAGVKIGWFSLGGSASSRKENLDITKDSIGMVVKFKNFTTIDIAPGTWFSGDAIKTLWEGPYKQGAIASKTTLFGPKGSFKPRVAKVVLVHRPTITLKLSASQYNKVVESWSGSGSIGVGPFSFGGSKAGGKDELTEDKASNSITLEDKTGIPQIIAVYTVSYPQR